MPCGRRLTASWKRTCQRNRPTTRLTQETWERTLPTPCWNASQLRCRRLRSVVPGYAPSTTPGASSRTKSSPKRIDKTIVRYPVYVGKAVPPGARKGALRQRSTSGHALANRLNQHAASINQANNLNLRDFSCRYLVVDDILRGWHRALHPISGCRTLSPCGSSRSALYASFGKRSRARNNH